MTRCRFPEHHKSPRTVGVLTVAVAVGFAAVLIVGTARLVATTSEPLLIATAGLLALATITGVVWITSHQQLSPPRPVEPVSAQRPNVIEHQAAGQIPATVRELHQHVHLHGSTPDVLTRHISQAAEPRPVERDER